MNVRRAINYCFTSYARIYVGESTGRFISAESCTFSVIKLFLRKRYTE